MMEQKIWINQIEKALKSLLDFKKITIAMRGPGLFSQYDLIADVQYDNIHFKLTGEIVDMLSSASFRDKINSLKQFVDANSIPVIIAKYFSSERQEECKKTDICFIGTSWLDFRISF